MTTITPDKITIELDSWGGIEDWEILTTALVEALYKATSDPDYTFGDSNSFALAQLIESLIDFRLEETEPLPEMIGRHTWLPVHNRLAV